MPRVGCSTKDFLQRLCDQLGHHEGAAPCVKKLVGEHWLYSFDDLRRVPRQRFERWGMPLKLIDELCEALVEADANAAVSGMQAYVNYSLKPTFAWLSSGSAFEKLRDDAERRRNPEVWAAKRIWRAWCRHRQRVDQRLLALSIAEAIDDGDVSRMTGPKLEEVRRRRAEERLRRMVRRWKARRAARGGGGGRAAASSSSRGRPAAKTQEDEIRACAEMCPPSGAGALVMATSARECRGKLRDCEVTQLLRKFSRKMERPWLDIVPYAHRLVTFNWLEAYEDLSIVEDRHWDAWDVPERLVVMIKAELEADTKPGYRSAAISAVTGGASCCCLGDCCGAFVDWFAGFLHYSQESESQKAREEENQRDAEAVARSQRSRAPSLGGGSSCTSEGGGGGGGGAGHAVGANHSLPGVWA